MKNKNKYKELEGRMTNFAKNIAKMCNGLPKNNINNELIKQIIRSSGSVGANYMEANDSLGKKDLKFRIKIARKEAEETNHWFEIIKSSNSTNQEKIDELICECRELRNILTAILSKIENS